VLFVGVLQFQGQFGDQAAQGRCGVPFMPEFLARLGESRLELVTFCGDLADAVGDERLGADAGLVVLDKLFVVAVDDVASQPGLDDQLAGGEAAGGRS
jgi:hypothetical protein